MFFVSVRQSRSVQFKGQTVGPAKDEETMRRYEQLELLYPGSDAVSEAQVDAVKPGLTKGPESGTVRDREATRPEGASDAV